MAKILKTAETQEDRHNIFDFSKKRTKPDALGEALTVDESTASKDIYSIWNHRTNHRIQQLIIAVVIILLYVFFFLSPLIFHASDEEDLQTTPLQTAIQFQEDKTVTISSWDWSPQQNAMVIKLVYDNQSFDGLNEYQYQVKLKKGDRKANVVQVVDDADLGVLYISNLPDEWVNLVVNVAYKDSKDVLVQLFATETSVTTVSELSQKSSNEYRAELYQEKMTPYLDQIEELQKQMSGNNTRIATLETQRKELRKVISQQLPEAEIEQHTQEIRQIGSQIDSLTEQNAELQAQIDEANAAIAELENTYNYYLGKYDESVNVRTTKTNTDNQVVLKSTTRPNTRVVGEETTTHKDGEIVVIDDVTTTKKAKT